MIADRWRKQFLNTHVGGESVCAFIVLRVRHCCVSGRTSKKVSQGELDEDERESECECVCVSSRVMDREMED